MAASKTALFPTIESGSSKVRASVDNRVVDLLTEQAFVQVLRLERRRTQRSGNPFLLVLLSGWTLEEQGRVSLVEKVVRAISSRTRETDVLGWYDQDQTLGLLLTEIGKAGHPTVDVIVEKISEALKLAVDPKEFSRLRLVIRVFPQPPGTEAGGEKVIYPDLLTRNAQELGGKIVKRAIDIAGSLFALVLFLPVFLGIAVLVKLTSRGPVLYCQKRVGQYGRLFNFFKFRSMYTGNDPAIHQKYVANLIDGKGDLKQANGAYKLVDDPRVTPLGKFLRRTSLDELPQFLNVLRGDMSLVGPRPPVPYEFALYRAWHKRRVLEIKPGLTGLWQVKGRSRTTFDEMVRMDIRYALTRSLVQDIKIILQTPGAMFSGTGAF